MLGDDVGARSSLDHADAHRRPLRRRSQRVDLRDLIGHLEDGVDPRPRVVAGVCRAPGRFQDEDAGALPTGLERSVGQGGLQAQDPLVPPRQIFNEGARGAAARLFVGGEQAANRGRRANPVRVQSLQGSQGDGDAALHVQRARPIRPASLDPPGRPGDRPDRVHGVEMMEKQAAAVAAAPRSQPVVADFGLGNPLHRASQRLPALRQPLAEQVDQRLLRCRRFHLDQLLQRIQHPLLAGAEVRERETVHHLIITSPVGPFSTSPPTPSPRSTVP